MTTVSSSFESRTIRPVGGLVAATRRPWYRRVLIPEIVEEANPPRPLVSSHSRLDASAKLPQTSLLNSIIRLNHSGPVVIPLSRSWGKYGSQLQSCLNRARSRMIQSNDRIQE